MFGFSSQVEAKTIRFGTAVASAFITRVIVAKLACFDTPTQKNTKSHPIIFHEEAQTFLHLKTLHGARESEMRKRFKDNMQGEGLRGQKRIKREERQKGDKG